MEHFFDVFGRVNLLGNGADEFDLGGALAGLGKETAVGDGGGGLVGQNAQQTQVALVELVGFIALGGQNGHDFIARDKRDVDA